MLSSVMGSCTEEIVKCLFQSKRQDIAELLQHGRYYRQQSIEGSARNNHDSPILCEREGNEGISAEAHTNNPSNDKGNLLREYNMILSQRH